jgi:peptide/nickel transport system substrate-binding protein
MKKLVSLAVVLTMFALILIGCSTTVSTSTSSSTTTSTSTVASTSTQATSSTTAQSSTSSPPTSPTETKVTGGTLKIAATSPTTLGYPARMRSLQDYVSSAPALESLAHYDTNGNMIPWLATDWKVDSTAGTVTLSLRKGVKFHDGTDFNAQAVKDNFDIFVTEKREEVGSVKSVDIVDDYTVRVNLSAWDNTFISMLGTLVMISPTAFKAHDVDWAIANPVGTGPFQFVSWERDVSIKYKKFDGYWQKGKPYLDGIEFLMIADPTVAVASFMRGEVDILAAASPDDYNDLKASSKYNVVTLQSGGSQLAGIGGDGSHPDSIFSDLKVRQAISYAIDNDAIADAIFKGQAIGVNQWAIPTNWGYNSQMTGYPYDPDKAKELLTEAGYPDGFSTTLYGPNWAGTTPLELTAIQGYLGKIGINVQLDTTGTWSTMIREGWQNCLVYICPKLGSDVSVEMRKTLPSTALIFGASLIHPEEIDQLFTKVTSVVDANTKKDLVHQLQQLAFEKYVQFTPVRVTAVTCAKYPYLHDDGMYLTESTQWAPEDAWMEKH